MKTIEEIAKSAINANGYFMADPSNPSFVDRGLEQYRAMMWMAAYIMSLPLADRLADEERENIKAIYQNLNKAYHAPIIKKDICLGVHIADCVNIGVALNKMKLLERIFGKEMFAEEGGNND